ncbi:hypothetical protein [Formosa haliotis]|nr:hypothetical protein [Formosa haliotis]
MQKQDDKKPPRDLEKDDKKLKEIIKKREDQTSALKKILDQFKNNNN